MEHIEQIRELFYSNNIELAIQLIKSVNYNLKDLLEKWIKDEGFNKSQHWIFVRAVNPLDSEDGILLFFNKKHNYHVLWLFGKHVMCYNGISECIDKLLYYLTENYG